MQVIEKVKVVPEGYNGAGMNYDGGNRRDVNGKANAGLTLGIIGTALGAEIAPLTQEQQNMLLSNQDYVNNYNALLFSDSSLFYLSKF